MSTNDKDLIRNNYLFSLMSDLDFELFLSLGKSIELPDNQLIFDSGQPSNQFFIVLEGAVSIHSERESLKTEIARFVPGNIIGDLDYFKNGKRTATGVSHGASRLFEFPGSGDSIDQLAVLQPYLAANLLAAFLGSISERIRNINKLVKNNSAVMNELKRQVYVDELTGLNNKTRFEETLSSCIEENRPFGLIFYKPDNFKRLNDSFGHEIGDHVLGFIGKSLKDFVPDPDMIYRFQGNSNVIIVPNATRDSLKEQAKKTGDFLRNLDLSSIEKHIDFSFSVSFGLGLYPEHGDTVEKLIENVHALPLEGRQRGGNLMLFPEDV